MCVNYYVSVCVCVCIILCVCVCVLCKIPPHIHIPGTRKLHSFVPISDSTVEVKFYSSSHISRKEKVALAKNDVPTELIAGFVTCLHEEKWWLACVLEVCYWMYEQLP